jgi:hypothetical protein
MLQDNSTLLTTQLKNLLGSSTSNENFDVVIIVNDNIRAAIFKLYNKSIPSKDPHIAIVHVTSYSQEKTIFGQSIRLVDVLDTRFNMLSWLIRNEVSRIVVSTSKDPRNLNSSNHRVFDTNDIEQVFRGFRQTASLHPNAKEIAIETLIAENTR